MKNDVLDKAQRLAVSFYEMASNLPEEEKWGLSAKLRGRAFDLTQDYAEAVGSIDPRDRKWQFGLARRDAFGLSNAAKMYESFGYGELSIELMRDLQDITRDIESNIEEASTNIPRWFKEMSAPEEKK